MSLLFSKDLYGSNSAIVFVNLELSRNFDYWVVIKENRQIKNNEGEKPNLIVNNTYLMFFIPRK